MACAMSSSSSVLLPTVRRLVLDATLLTKQETTVDAISDLNSLEYFLLRLEVLNRHLNRLNHTVDGLY